MRVSSDPWLFILFSYPALAVPAAHRHGCRQNHFVLVQIIGSFRAVLLWAPLVGYSRNHGLAEGAVTYLLATTAAIMLAMALNPDLADDDDDAGESVDGGPPAEPQGIDWDDFERHFWDEVKRSRRRDPAPV